MECPKCGLEIDDKALVCPNCKKVLKLVCPVCKAINEGSTCKKCGYVIVTKCNKCGKVNQTAKKKCSNCGFSLEKSVILNESNTDNFVILTIDFPNMADMKTLLGSAKLVNKFKINLDKIIYDYAKSVGLRRQLIGNTYVIRFDKDYTIGSSANNAMTAAVELLNQISKTNARLTKKKNATVRCNMFLLKRSIEDDPNNLDSGFNINLLSSGKGGAEEKVLNAFQVLSDCNVQDILSKDYEFAPLNSVMIDGEMKMFYEVNVKDLITVEHIPDDEDEKVEIPNFVQNMLMEQDKIDGMALRKMDTPYDPDAIYDLETIQFGEVQADFVRTENIDVFYHLINRLQSMPKGILAIKTMELYKPYSLKIINSIEELNLYKNIISVTCYDEMKYSPYSFFRELVSAIFGYTVSQKLFSTNDFSMFASVDPDSMIKDLITLNKRNTENAEDTRYVYYDIFLTLLQVIPNTLIFIENFEKIDASSYDVLKYLFAAFDKLDISYLISYENNFSLHRDTYFLLEQPYYSEMALKPTPFEKMIEEHKNYYRNILNDFYFQRIAKYSCGSILFLDFALQYLVESGVYRTTDDSIELDTAKTIIIPSSLSKLLKRRLNLLEDEPDTLKFLASLLLLGTRIDFATIESLGFENTDEIIEKLSGMGYIYQYNNCIYFPNYNLLRQNLLDSVKPELLKEIAKELFDKVFVDNMPSPTKAYLYNLLEEYDKEFEQWEQLADINLSMGDFSSYLNCAYKIIELMETRITDDNFEDVDKYKSELYDKISNNLYQYIPSKTSDIAEITLSKLENNSETEKIIELCNKMILGSLEVGNYHKALELMHKVLSLIPNSSLDPDAPNFNKYFFLMSFIHIEILFNIGALKDCLDVGYKVMGVVKEANLEKLRPQEYTPEQFKNMLIGSIGFIALANVLNLSGNVQEFLTMVSTDLQGIPASYSIFPMLEQLIHGQLAELPELSIAPNDRFASALYHIMSAFAYLRHDPVKFAEEIYIAKLNAKDKNLHQIELFCDLLIGASYMDIESYTKATDIFYKIVRETGENGMTNMLYFAWFFMSEYNLRMQKYDVAYGIVNNVIIQLEKSDNSCDYLLLLFKYNMFKVLMYMQQFDKAKLCIEQAISMAERKGIHFEFDLEASHYIPEGGFAPEGEGQPAEGEGQPQEEQPQDAQAPDGQVEQK